MTTKDAPLCGDKTLPEWDQDWAPEPGWQNPYQDDLRYLVGLYRFIQNGRIMLIDVGTDKQGALATRLSDYRRPSPSTSTSTRLCRSGQYIYENCHLLRAEALVIGDVNDEQAAKTSLRLKTHMTKRHKPEFDAHAKAITYRTPKARTPARVMSTASAF